MFFKQFDEKQDRIRANNYRGGASFKIFVKRLLKEAWLELTWWRQ